MHEITQTDIEVSEVIALSLEDQHFLIETLLLPAEPTDALRRAKERYQQLITPESEQN